MKTQHMILIALAAGFSAAAETTTNAPVTNTPAPAVATNTVAAATNAALKTDVEEPEMPVTNSIRLNFHDVPLSTVVAYLSKRMGFVFSSDVDLRGNTTIVSEQPIGTNEVLQLLGTALAKNDYALTTNGKVLNITSASTAKTGATTPVLEINTPDQLPMSDEIATVVLPVHTLVPQQLIKDLADVIPPGTTADANEAGNAIIMTGRKKDIRRFDQIIAALDSSSISAVKVFVLKYADAKSVAEELKEVFQSPDSNVARSDSRQRFSRFGNGFFGGPGGGEGNNNSEQKNASNKAVFTSDDQMNAVVAAAPPDYFTTITNVINDLDQPNQEITMMRVFRLHYADAQETADLLGNLFPDQTKTSTDQNSRSLGYRFMPPWMQQQPAGNNQSARMKLQTEVRAVPDMRTSSVVVTASKDMMEQIANVIEELDHDPAGIQGAYAFSLDNADPTTVATVVQALFQGQNQRSQQATQTSALQQRETSTAQQQTSSSTTGFGTGGGMGTTALH